MRPPAARKRRIILRAALALLWILLGAVIFVRWRSHTLLIDNRDVPELSLRAPGPVTVSVDGGKGIEFLRGDRDRITVGGSRHRVRVEFGDGRPPAEADFTLSLREDAWLLSVPRLAAGAEPFVEVFRSAPESRVPEEDEPPGGDGGPLVE